MNRIFTALAAAVLVTGAAQTGRAQDIHFSQFYENASLRNPALTGIFSGDYKAGVNYRTQWGSISVPFQTVLASAETRVSVSSETDDYLSFGLTTTYDKAGSISFNSFSVMPAINYNKNLEDEHGSYLSMGFAAAYVQRSVDPSKMTFDNQYGAGGFDPANPTGENITVTSMQHFDLSAGLSFNSSFGEEGNVNYYVGGAAYHLTKPQESFDQSQSFIRLTTKYTGQAGINWTINPNMSFTAHLNYLNQKPYQEWIGGGLLGWRHSDASDPRKSFTLYGGLFYRLGDAVIPTFKVDYNSYSVTMSYDLNNSGLRHSSGGMGGYEVSLYVRGKLRRSNPKDYLKCPRFEMRMPNFE
jgi:type IX secretion system PorP/SprF family membrane protein